MARGLADPKAGEWSLSLHCEVGAMLATHAGLGQSGVGALAHAYERWDGKGFEDDAIPPSSAATRSTSAPSRSAPSTSRRCSSVEAVPAHQLQAAP
jgi:hypothetical protein